MSEFPERLEEIADELEVDISDLPTLVAAVDRLRFWLADARSEAEQHFIELEAEIDGFEFDEDGDEVDQDVVKATGD